MKRFFLAMLIALSCAFTFCGCYDSEIDRLAEAVLESMDETFEKNPDTEDIIVSSVTLVHESGNEYSGVAEITDGEETANIKLHVVYDGSSFIWEVVD